MDGKVEQRGSVGDFPQHIRVLLVEDNPTDALLARESLFPLGHVTLSTAERLGDAFKLLARETVDIILLDLGLPDSQGLGTLAELRRHAPHIPVVVLTGNDDEQMGLSTLHNGAQDFLVKRQIAGMDVGRAVLFALERNRLAQALRESEERHRRILDVMPGGVFVSTDDRIAYGNPAFAAMMGAKSQDELLGRPPLSIFRPQFQAVIRERLETMREQNGSAPPIEEEVVALDGTIVPVDITASAIVHQGKPSILIVLRDLRKRKDVEDTFRTMVEGVKDYAIYSMDPAGRIKTWNAGAERICGYGAEEVIGRHYSTFFTEEDLAAGVPQRELRKAASSGKAAEEGWRLRKDGSRFWVYGILTSLYDRSGNVRGFCKVARDLTEPRQAVAALRDSEQRFRAFMDNSPASAWITDGEGRLVYISETFRRMFQVPPGDIREKTVFDVFPRALAEGCLETARTALQNGSMTESIETARRADGTPGEFWVFNFPIPSADGRFVGGAALDVTETKRAESDLRLRDRAIQAVSQGIIITDARLADQPIIFANQGFERITGYRVSDVIGKNCRFLQGRQTDPQPIAELRQAVAAGRDCSVEIMNYKHDGTPFWNSLTITPLRDEFNRLLHYVGILSDVTDRKKLEQALNQSQKMEAIGQLAGGVAHDFNNLLTVISGYAEHLLAALPADHPHRDPVKQIQHAGERAAGMTKQLLAFGRQTVLEPKVLEPNAVIRETEKMLHRLIGENIYLTTVLDPHVSRIKVDPSQLAQILVNLAVNARDAMPKGGRLTIETSAAQLDEAYVRTHPDAAAGQFVRISVNDNGVGMPPEVKARMFEPFFTTKGVGKGTGLGLSVVHGIVRQSGGSIEVYSEVGFGTTFKIYFPAVDQPLSAPSDIVPAAVRGTETILLVEDEDGVRALATLALRNHGYTVLAANTGTEALRLLEEPSQSIDLLLTDVVMPGLDGRELAEIVRNRFPKVKVLYLSGYTDDAVVRHGVLREEMAFLQKPFTLAGLARKVRQVLGEPAQSS